MIGPIFLFVKSTWEHLCRVVDIITIGLRTINWLSSSMASTTYEWIKIVVQLWEPTHFKIYSFSTCFGWQNHSPCLAQKFLSLEKLYQRSWVINMWLWYMSWWWILRSSSIKESLSVTIAYSFAMSHFNGLTLILLAMITMMNKQVQVQSLHVDMQRTCTRNCVTHTVHISTVWLNYF